MVGRSILFFTLVVLMVLAYDGQLSLADHFKNPWVCKDTASGSWQECRDCCKGKKTTSGQIVDFNGQDVCVCDGKRHRYVCRWSKWSCEECCEMENYVADKGQTDRCVCLEKMVVLPRP